MKHYSLVFDAIYTPKDTRLLREAKESGKIIVYGTEMLIRQGFEQYKNFTGLPGKTNSTDLILFSFFFFHFFFLADSVVSISISAPEELFRELMSKHA